MAPALRPAPGFPSYPTLGPELRVIRSFDAAERIEFSSGRPVDAAARYRALAASADPGVRAGALLRLGRVLRKAGDLNGALEAYTRLARLGATRTENLPADLAALAGRRAVLASRGDHSDARRVAAEIAAGLDEGRWLLTRGTAEYLREETGPAGRPESWSLAEALSDAWESIRGRPAVRGQRLAVRDGRPVLVLWRSNGANTAMLAVFADRFVAPPASAAAVWRLVDPAGQLVAGTASTFGRSAVRIVGGPEFAWTLSVALSSRLPADARGRRVTWLLMLGAALSFVWAASYFIGRAIRREAGVARLQSDFVAAVSHEFRSPLTAVRQMAEMLETDRVPTGERRHAYYRTIAAEAARLERLVENLLTFGQIEAGAARYQFADIDAVALVRAVVRDMEPGAENAGPRLETSGPDGPILVRADRNALALALRNLVENAVKYSAGQPAVWVRWGTDGDRAVIGVADRGIGIPSAEQRAIFRKFVRGRAAAEGNVRGTGVGLSMAQDIVRAHRGAIRLESEVGRGSTFTIELPLCGASR